MNTRTYATLVLFSLFVCLVVIGISVYQTSTYEATAVLLVSQQEQSEMAPGIHPIPNYTGPAQAEVTQMVAVAIDTLPGAKETLRRLNLPRASLAANELLDNLTVESETGTMFVRLTYTDTDPKRAQLIVNTVAEVSSDLIPTIDDPVPGHITAIVWRKAKVPTTPVSPKPLRNGLIALVATASLSLVVGTLIGAIRNR
jgi:capsular polysaccharide biosynthesis protein